MHLHAACSAEAAATGDRDAVEHSTTHSKHRLRRRNSLGDNKDPMECQLTDWNNTAATAASATVLSLQRSWSGPKKAQDT
jgi:hypothetical protein